MQCFKGQVPDAKFRMPYNIFEVPCADHHVPNARFQIPMQTQEMAAQAAISWNIFGNMKLDLKLLRDYIELSFVILKVIRK